MPKGADQVQELMASQLADFRTKRAAAEARGIDLIAERISRYLTRWKEALVYVNEGEKILDLGVGWMPPQIFEMLIKERGHNYHAFDVDRSSIQHLVDLGITAGLPASNFKTGEVSCLPFDGKFSLVFSSHCLEHAVDIVGTLAEIRRVLKDGGVLFMSVPLGFDDSDEHLLFHGPGEWIAMLTAAGFEVLAHTIGTIYTASADLTILARHRDAAPADPATSRGIAERFSKAGRTLLRSNHESLTYPNGASAGGGAQAIMQGVGSRMEATLQVSPRALVVTRHPWSGMLRISDGTSHTMIDCYHTTTHQYGVDLTGFKPDFEVELIGRNPLSKGFECVVAGVLI
ncbi:class I SAM-dependent methyltransferase [Variovorax sp. CCNWLW235]